MPARHRFQTHLRHSALELCSKLSIKNTDVQRNTIDSNRKYIALILNNVLLYKRVPSSVTLGLCITLIYFEYLKRLPPEDYSFLEESAV
jgi:hypothetical protein